MACDGNWSKRGTCLHSLFFSRGRNVRLNEILYLVYARVHYVHLLHQPKSDLQMVRSVLELDCMMVVTRYMSTILYWRKVVGANFVADQNHKMEDTLDLCSS